TNPDARVMFGGVAGLTVRPASTVVEFAKDALEGCPGKVDIMAYHSYAADPSGTVRPPEEIDTAGGAADFRKGVLSISGVRPDLEFWLNEWNANPEMKGSNPSVQARYVPRFYLEQLAHNIRGFVWEFMAPADFDEKSPWGILKGDTQGPDAFQPREAFFAFQNLSAVFGQTVRDVGGENALNPPKEYAPDKIRSYWFRDRASGRRVFAYWVAIPSNPKDDLKPVMTEMTITDKNITQPVLMDIRTGDIQKLRWSDKATRTVNVPLKDSVMAVADATYLDWIETPRTPAELVAERRGEQIELHWKPSPGAFRFEVQRSDDFNPWRPVGEVTAPVAEFSEKSPGAKRSTYRVRAINAYGASPWSNPAWAGQ
ncbi:MAG TPA: fibronectin type III domain-containing protein, partial [Terriglobia bacterium]|nr:fibronectin type III domain-containing protein [Terriglobia bacterium]